MYICYTVLYRIRYVSICYTVPYTVCEYLLYCTVYGTWVSAILYRIRYVSVLYCTIYGMWVSRLNLILFLICADCMIVDMSVVFWLSLWLWPWYHQKVVKRANVSNYHVYIIRFQVFPAVPTNSNNTQWSTCRNCSKTTTGLLAI